VKFCGSDIVDVHISCWGYPDGRSRQAAKQAGFVYGDLKEVVERHILQG
jgi:hypothetical protein